jgi:hypothetical protein
MKKYYANIVFVLFLLYSCNHNNKQIVNKNISINEIISLCNDSLNLSALNSSIAIHQRGYRGKNLFYHIGKVNNSKYEECYTILVNTNSNNIDTVYRKCYNNDYLTNINIKDIIKIVTVLKINTIISDTMGNVYFKAFNSEHYNLMYSKNDKVPEKKIYAPTGKNNFMKYCNNWYIDTLFISNNGNKKQ